MERQPGKVTVPLSIVDVWQQVVNTVADLLTIPSVMINRLDPPELEVLRSNMGADNPFPSGSRMDAAGVYCESTARQRRKVQVTDARTDPDWFDSPTAKAGMYAYLGYPLLWPNGEVFGTIWAVDTKENEWGPRYDKLLQTFKGVIEMHLALISTLQLLDDKNTELERTIGEVKTLRGVLPICASCKKTRDDRGYWQQIEDYLENHSEVEFSHSLCPECERNLYPEFGGDS